MKSPISADRAAAGADLTRPLDALFINAPLRDYSIRPRVNDFTLPVLGMGYIATYAQRAGFNVGVIDAESLGLGVTETADLVNTLSPRWAGFNLLAPTYEISARLTSLLDPLIRVLVGGHLGLTRPVPSTPHTSPSPAPASRSTRTGGCASAPTASSTACPPAACRPNGSHRPWPAIGERRTDLDGRDEPAHTRRMLRMVARLAVISVTVAAAVVAVQQPASAACGGETTKFVYTSGSTYGNMGTMYVYPRTIDSGCNLGVANTIFMRLSAGYLDFVEIGTRQFRLEPGTFRLFFEYQDFPAPVYVYEGTNQYAYQQYISFNVSNYSGLSYDWKGQYSLGTSQSVWTTFGVTPAAMVDNKGLAEGEIARFGLSEATAYEYHLKRRPSSGGWTNWTSLSCDMSQQSITNYDAVKQSNNAWYTNPGSPPAGDC